MTIAILTMTLLQSVVPATAPALARVEAVPVKSAVKSGATVTLEVMVTPREGIHVYAPPQKQYIPVSIAIDPPPRARVGKPVFPASVTMTFEGEKVRVYDKPFSILVPVILPASAAPAAIAGTVTYQACDDVMCYRPVKVPVRWDLRLQ